MTPVQSFAPLGRHSGIVAVIDGDNIDTDQIVPRQFLGSTDRGTLKNAFLHEWRYDRNGAPLPAFVLNRPPYDEATILLVGRNFGCGSGREHAAWALLAAGIRVIIGLSFNATLVANAASNGVACVTILPEHHQRLAALANNPATCRGEFDLAHERFRMGALSIDVAIDAFQREALMHGQSATDIAISRGASVGDYERARKTQFPWLPIHG